MTDRSVGMATRDPGEVSPLCGPNGEVVSGSIAEVAYLRLCGLEPRPERFRRMSLPDDG
jgi:hypothetical protein